jgi:hypothetical protein
MIFHRYCSYDHPSDEWKIAENDLDFKIFLKTISILLLRLLLLL